MAGSEAAKEAIYLTTFLRELGFSVDTPPLKLDNKSAIDLAYNPEHHSRVKHIERRHLFIRECVEEGKIRVPFVPTADNVADFFTKPLMGKHFFNMRDKVMNVKYPSRSSCNSASTQQHVEIRPSSSSDKLADALVNAEDKYEAAMAHVVHG